MKYKFIKIIDDINAVKALYPDMDENKFNELIKLDPTYKEGSNSVGTYGKWILNLYKKGNLKEEDFYKVTEYLTDFEKKKKAIKNKDIGTYKTLPDLLKAIQEVGEVEQSKNQLKKAISRTDIETDAEFIGDFDNYVCYSPKTYEASCKLGKGTHWCTATNSTDNYYNNYTSQGKLYIFIDKSTGQAEYQLHFETDSFMDKDDSPISLGNFVEKIPSSKNFIFEHIKQDIINWSVWDVIEGLGELAVNFIDTIKIKLSSKDKWDRRSIIKSIMRNKYLEPYFANEIKETIKNDESVVVNYLFNKEKREEYKDYFAKYFKLEDNTLKISSKTLAYYLCGYGETGNLSDDFIEACCYGEVWDQFEYYWEDIDSSDGEDELYDKNIKLLEDLHLKYENIPDEYRIRALSDAKQIGAINDCLGDFDYAIKEMVNGSFEELDLKKYIKEIKRYDNESFIIENFTLDNYFEILDTFKDKVNLDYNTFDEGEVDLLFPDEVISYMLSFNFDFKEPYYGWSNFDEDAFNEVIEEGIDAIASGETEPEFYDDEDEEEWHKWFNENYEVGIKKDNVAEGQQQMNLDSAKYVFIKTKG